MRVDRGMAKRSLRQKRILKANESILVKGFEGVVDKNAPAPGPLCDRNMAFWVSVSLGKRSSALKSCSTLEEASCCHPCLGLPGSWSSGSPPAAKLLHERTSNPWTPSRDLAAVVVDDKLCPIGTPSKWVLLALLRPRPPKASGKEAASRAVASQATSEMPIMVHKHAHKDLS